MTKRTAAFNRLAQSQWHIAAHQSPREQTRRYNGALGEISRTITREVKDNSGLQRDIRSAHREILAAQTGALDARQKSAALQVALSHTNQAGLLDTGLMTRLSHSLFNDAPIPTNPWNELAANTAGVDMPQAVLNPEIAASVLGPEGLLPPHWDDTHMPYLGAVMLDSGASTLMLGPVRDTLLALLPFYANTHSHEYRNALVMTHAVEHTETKLRSYFGADDSYAVMLEGSGATWGSNYVAWNLHLQKPQARVLYDLGSHHANILPWRRFNSDGISINPNNGRINLDELEAKLREGPVDMVAVTAVSNVDGSLNDIVAIRNILDRYKNSEGSRIRLFVDGAHAIHIPVNLKEWDADFITISGHKMYAPGSPGILMGKKDFFPQGSNDRAIFGGGGPLIFVGEENHVLSDSVALPGTPNIPGHALLAAAIETLEALGGPKAVWKHEANLTSRYLREASSIQGVHILGDPDFESSPRAGVVSLYLDGIPAAMAARVMGDLFAIYYRDGCVCAHPKVLAEVFHAMDRAGVVHKDPSEYIGEALAGNKGELPMILRHSMAVYTREDDVSRAVAALHWMMSHRDWIHEHYQIDKAGHVERLDGQSLPLPAIFPSERPQ